MKNLKDTVEADSKKGVIQVVAGLLLTGAGLSMAIDAGFVRLKKGKWVGYGTAALVVF